MALSETDVVCRFVRPSDWSKEEDRPKPGAFKDPRGVTFWHEGKLHENDAAVSDLKIGHLEGWGEAYYEVGDLCACAEKAGQREGQTLAVSLDWKPETVSEEWRPWDYAHMEMDEPASQREAMTVFRRKLSLRARRKEPPKFD